ncbi:MAG: NADAR family protein, partial [Anaerolineae bacterium]|nr:NADAR family protein [Anaerolineae bacterium]
GAKAAGQLCIIRSDWKIVKDGIMFGYLVQKFGNPALKRKLLQTQPRLIIEGNSWNDRYWGQCPVGNGKNMLGRMLMAIRDDTQW